MIKVTCPECRKKYSVIDSMAGKEIRCHSCDYLFKAPEKKISKWISTACKNCNKLYRVSQEMLGSVYNCTRCKQDFKVINFDEKAQLKASCPKCGKRYRIVNEKLLGQKICCKVCETDFVIKISSDEHENLEIKQNKNVKLPTVVNYKLPSLSLDDAHESESENENEFDNFSLSAKKVVAFNSITDNTQKPKNRKINANNSSKVVTPVRKKTFFKPIRQKNKVFTDEITLATSETIVPSKSKVQEEIARQIQKMEGPTKTEVSQKPMTKEELEFATSETLNPQNKTMQREIARQIQEMEGPAKTEVSQKPMTKEELEFATGETLNPQNKAMQNEIAKHIYQMEMEEPAKTEVSQKPMTKEELEFATGETLSPQNEAMQNEIARRIQEMEAPPKTKVSQKPMTKEELEFATGETLNPQNETMQNEIAKHIYQMEMEALGEKSSFSESSEVHIDLRATAEEIIIDDFIDEEDAHSQEINEKDESEDNIHIDLRATAEEIIIDDFIDEEDAHFQEISGKDESEDNIHIDLRATAEEIIIDDFIDEEDAHFQKISGKDESEDNIHIDLRATAEEIIIDDFIDEEIKNVGMDPGNSEDEESVVEIEEIEDIEDIEDEEIEEIEDDLDDLDEEKLEEKTKTDKESSLNMAAIAATSQDDSGFLKLGSSEDMLVASEVVASEEDDVLVTPNRTERERHFQFSLTGQFVDEHLEKTASMLVIEAENDTEEEWVDSKQNDWNIGDVIIGLYSVTEEIGIAEFGKIYKIYHKQLSINMAVKSISFKNCDRDILEKELDAWAKLGIHTHILSFYYMRNLKGIPRVFMEYVDGEDLSVLIRKDNNEPDSLYRQNEYSSLKRIFDIAIQIAWGLSHAHKNNVTHKDIKPENIMVSTDNTVKISNFALKKVYGKVDNIYASKNFENEKLMDIWGWGLCLLEMFCGKVYWKNGEDALKELKQYSSIKRKQNVPEMPDELIEVLEKCFLGEYDSFENILPEILNIYQKVTEIDYTRHEPDVTLNMADGLNNRAVFLMDLEKYSEAEELLNEALVLDNHHIHVTYNLGLLQWRNGVLTDIDLVHKLNMLLSIEMNKWQVHYFLAWLHIERGAKEATLEALKKAEKSSDGNIVIQNIIAQAMDSLTDTYDLQHTLKGHEESVGSVCVSEDMGIAISSSSDGSIRIWNIKSGECKQILLGHKGYVNGIALSPDGKNLASASWDKSIRIWDVETGECCNVINGHENYVNDVVFSGDGESLVSGSWDHSIRVWDVHTGLCKKVLRGHSKNINGLDLSSEVDIVISGSSDNTVRVWDMNSGECLRVLKGHEDEVWDVAITSDGDMAISASWDQTIRVWDIWSGQCLKIIKGHTGKIASVHLSKDASKIITSSWDGTVRIWDVAKGCCLRTFDKHEDKVHDVCFSNSSNIFVSASADQTLQVWKLAKQKNSAPFMIVRAKENTDNRVNQNLVTILLAEIRKAITNEKWEAAANLLNTARQKRGYERYPECLELWEKLALHTARGTLKGAWQRNVFDDHKHYIESIAYNHITKHCFVASYNKIYKWDLQKCECLGTFYGHNSRIKKIVIAANSNLLFSCGDDKTIKIWDADNGICKETLVKHEYSVRSIAVMPNGYLGISASYKNLSVWNMVSGTYLFDLIGHEHWVESVAMTPDGRMAISGSHDKTVRIWDVASAKCIKILKGHDDSVRSVAISIDGRMAVSGSYDNTVRVWDVSTGKCLNVLKGHKDRVESVTMSSDGQIAVSASWDKTLRMWDISTGKNLCTLEGHMDKLRSVMISPNANLAMAGGWGKSLRIWNIDWELIPKSKNRWDDNVRIWLESFLSVHTPIESEDPINPLFLVRKGKPTWKEEDLEYLKDQLQNSGLGWLDTKKVLEKLNKMANKWEKPPVLPGNT